ncbi:MAG: peptidoglycan-binding protein [Bryobacteraceae bacterium]|nr:peptidoglycan-binding protein [Bryobacteraceae bacterium]
MNANCLALPKSWMLVLAVGAMLAMGCLSIVGAQPVGGDKRLEEKNKFNRDLANLKRTKPAEYEKMRSLMTVLAESLLARLGYGIGPLVGTLDEKGQNALGAYEKSRGLPVTRNPLSFETMEKIAADVARLDADVLRLPSLSVSIRSWDYGFVRANGTWTISGDKMADPVQTTEITCSKESGTCREATAKILGDSGTRSLYVDTDIYEIASWDEKEIVTKPLEFDCTQYIRRISRTQKSVTGIRSTISREGTCASVANMDLFLVLVDGSKLSSERFREQRRATWDLMQISKEVAALLKEIQ